MFYIVRYWMAGKPYEQNFDTLDEARNFAHALDCRAEIYVWLGGREEYMEG